MKVLIRAGGMSLEQLAQTAMQKRADLQAERQKLSVAEAKLKAESAWPNPQFDAEYGSAAVFGKPDTDLRLGIEQTFQTGGKGSKRVAVARLEAERARLEIFKIERELVKELRVAYVGVLTKARRLEFFERILADNLEFLRIMEARVAEGDAAPLDANLLRVETDSSRVAIAELRGELEADLFTVKQLTGLDVNDDLVLAPLPEAPPRLETTLAELQEIALRSRSDLQISRQNEAIAAAQANLAAAGRIPDITGSVAFEQKKEDFDLPNANFIKKDKALVFGASIEIPLSRRYRAEEAAALAEKASAEFQTAFLTAKIKAEAASAFRRYRAAAEVLVLYSTQILPRSEENLRSIRAAYGLGEFSLFEVITEQRKLNESLEKFNEALRNYYEAITAVEAAIGTSVTAYLSDDSSVLPDKDLVPVFDRQSFLNEIKQDKIQIVRNKEQ